MGFNPASIAADMVFDKSAGKVCTQWCGCGPIRAGGAGAGAAAAPGIGARDIAAVQTYLIQPFGVAHSSVMLRCRLRQFQPKTCAFLYVNSK